MCCIKENPEPVVFPLCCQGVRVELGVSPKQVHFDKLLLHRSATPGPSARDKSSSGSLAGDVPA